MALDIVRADSVRQRGGSAWPRDRRRPLPRRRHARRPRRQRGRPLDHAASCSPTGSASTDPHRRRPGRNRRRRDHGGGRGASRPRRSCIRSRARSAGRPCAPWRPSAAISLRRLSLWRFRRGAARARRGRSTVEDARAAARRSDLEAFLPDARAKRGADRAQRVVRASPAGRLPLRQSRRRKHPHGASVLSIAAVLPMAGGKICRRARRLWRDGADGRCGRAPSRQALEGRALDAATIDAAGKVAAEGCAPADDPLASAWYRRNVLPVHLGRLLAG